MKVVINKCFGGFGLSVEAIKRYAEITNAGADNTYDQDLLRNDPALVQTVLELGDKANGRYASLVIIEIPDDVEYEICDYDGQEHIAERHRTWG